MAQFCETFRHNAQTVLSALQMLQTSGYLSFSEQVFVPTRIQVVAGREVLENLEFAHPHLDVVMKALLRGYEGILDFPVSVREAALANALNLSEEELVSRLRQMVGHALIEHQPKKDTPQLFFLYPRVRKNELNIDEKKYWERRSLYQKQVGSMERYATQISECRSSLIRRHFGDNQATDCGLCDRCLAKRKPQTSADELKKACTTIANFLEKPQSALQLRKRCLQMASSTFDEALKRLQEEERVIQTPNGLLMLNT
jgi:ATP-dependent DNA helicase RecQ